MTTPNVSSFSRLRRSMLALLPLLAAIPASALAATYYVATSGSDSAAGTLAAPFKGITKAQSVAATDSNYNYVHNLTKGGITYAAYGFYFTNKSTGTVNNCDSYNNIGPTSTSIGNTDGFGAHGNGVVFNYCRSWHNRRRLQRLQNRWLGYLHPAQLRPRQHRQILPRRQQ